MTHIPIRYITKPTPVPSVTKMALSIIFMKPFLLRPYSWISHHDTIRLLAGAMVDGIWVQSPSVLYPPCKLGLSTSFF